MDNYNDIPGLDDNIPTWDNSPQDQAPEWLHELEGDDTRPLLKTRSVKEILEERIPLYEYFADIVVDNTNMEKAISDIMEALK